MSNKNIKVVVITGCSSGIGFESAVLLAKEKGYKILATMRNLTKKGPLEKAAGNTLNKSLFIQELDVSKEESILKFVKATLLKEGRIDVLINNAAIGQAGLFEEVTLEQMQALFQTNFFGTVRLTQEITRKMKEQRSGKIIFISSIGGISPYIFLDFYIASKFAIEGLVGCLAPLLKTFNISVTSIQPGPVQTSFFANIKENKQGELSTPEAESDVVPKDAEMKELRDKLIANQMQRMKEIQFQTAEEVAEVIKKCVKDERPDVRIQTSKSTIMMAKEILVDPTGNNSTNTLAAILQ